MNAATIIGLIAGLTTTGAFLPQILKTIRTKDTKSISLTMYIVYVIGVLMWFVYGIMINEPAILISNSFSFVFGVTLLIMKMIYK